MIKKIILVFAVIVGVSAIALTAYSVDWDKLMFKKSVDVPESEGEEIRSATGYLHKIIFLERAAYICIIEEGTASFSMCKVNYDPKGNAVLDQLKSGNVKVRLDRTVPHGTLPECGSVNVYYRE